MRRGRGRGTPLPRLRSFIRQVRGVAQECVCFIGVACALAVVRNSRRAQEIGLLQPTFIDPGCPTAPQILQVRNQRLFPELAPLRRGAWQARGAGVGGEHELDFVEPTSRYHSNPIWHLENHVILGSHRAASRERRRVLTTPARMRGCAERKRSRLSVRFGKGPECSLPFQVCSSPCQLLLLPVVPPTAAPTSHGQE